MEDWLLPLQQGQPDVAWDRFLSRYRKLIFSSVRHYTRDYDDGMDVFAHVCEKLRADEMHRVRARAEDPAPRAKFSTWLVTVVRHLTVDWFRHRDGRRRLASLADDLTSRQRRIFELVFHDGRSHIETYEILRAGDAPDLTFREFCFELRNTYRAVSAARRGNLLRELGPVPPQHVAESEEPNTLEAADRSAHLRQVLGTLAPEDRAAVELYVIEQLPAEQVAVILGLANAKAVYNLVYRALGEVRARLAEAGIHRGDL